MVVKAIETFSTAILLILLAVFVLHLIEGDAMKWLGSKFSVADTVNIGPGSGYNKGGPIPKG
jgi:hypothetical protein